MFTMIETEQVSLVEKRPPAPVALGKERIKGAIAEAG
jgi:hypothetical protein